MTELCGKTETLRKFNAKWGAFIRENNLKSFSKFRFNKICCFLLSVEIYGEQQSRYFLEAVLTILGR